jgi:hypothetical protein
LAARTTRSATPVQSTDETASTMAMIEDNFQVARELPDDRRWRYMTAILCAAPEQQEAELRGMLTMDEQIELTETELKSAADRHGSTEARIRACGDPQLLERWATRAKTADDSAELFR